LCWFALGELAFKAVAVLVVVLELAFCTGWVIVASDNISIVVGNGLTRADVAARLFPVIGALACIRWLRQLWFLSLLGVIIYGEHQRLPRMHLSFLWVWQWAL